MDEAQIQKLVDKVHINQQSDKINFTCRDCGKEYPTLTQLHNHRAAQTDCIQRTRYKYTEKLDDNFLKQFEKETVDSVDKPAPILSKHFTEWPSDVVHEPLPQVQKDKVYKCYSCGMQYEYEDDFNLHLALTYSDSNVHKRDNSAAIAALDAMPDPSEQTHPEHYSQGATGRDLYALFINKYGIDAWQRHVIMECIQYLWRCFDKGTFTEDITKVKIICDRLLEEQKHGSTSTELNP